MSHGLVGTELPGSSAVRLLSVFEKALDRVSV